MQEFAYKTAGYSRPNKYLNLREAANAMWRGITAVLGEDKEPWLVIDYDGKDYLLENQAGQTQKLNTFDWLPASPTSRLVAASRLEASPLKAGIEVDGHKIGNLHYDSDWTVLHGDDRLPLEQYIAALEARKWAFDVGEREDEKADALRCPECGGHTVRLIDRDFNRFSCKTCGCQFEHEVMINPKAKVGYEVDRGDDYRPYAPGPDDPKKHENCDNCGYSWESHHLFSISGGYCPRCGEKHAFQQQETMDLEKGKKKAGINYDQTGNELITGKPYLLHSPRYKVPDLVYIVKADPTQVEAAIESGEDMHFPITIDESKYQKMMYSFEPFISKQSDYVGDPPFESPLWQSNIDCPYCGNPITPRDYDDAYEEYTCPSCRMAFTPEDLNQHFENTAKVGYDYTPTTDSMGGRDTGAPIKDQLPGYGTDIPNPSETAAQPTGPNPLQHETLGEHGVLFSPRGTVHNLTNMATGSNIMVMSDGQGGVMGWAVDNGMGDTSGINWSTQDMLKVQNAINSGLYQEMNSLNPQGISPDEEPLYIDVPDPVPTRVPMPETVPDTIPETWPEPAVPNEPEKVPAGRVQPVAPVSHIARKNFSPSEQRELIEEGEGETARNSHKLDLDGTHYIDKPEDDIDIDLLFW